ncbi:MAG: tail-specific protease, partial [Bacteroidota bacterium]
MKKRLPILFSGLLAVSFLSLAVTIPNNGGTEPEKEAVIMQAVVKNLERYHFDPANINDDFSRRTYDFFLNDLDGARLFFTQEDLAQLIQYRDQLDDESVTGTFTFFDKSQELHQAARTKTQVWYREILAKPFDLDEKATFTALDEESDWTANDKELREYWYGYLKRDALRRITNKLEEQEKRLNPDPEEVAEEKEESDEEKEEEPILTLEEIEE